MKKKRKASRKSSARQAKNGFEKVTPALLAWAKKRTSEKEVVAGLREIEKTGGLELKDFWTELQQAAKPR